MAPAAVGLAGWRARAAPATFTGYREPSSRIEDIKKRSVTVSCLGQAGQRANGADCPAAACATVTVKDQERFRKKLFHFSYQSL